MNSPDKQWKSSSTKLAIFLNYYRLSHYNNIYATHELTVCQRDSPFSRRYTFRSASQCVGRRFSVNSDCLTYGKAIPSVFYGDGTRQQTGSGPPDQYLVCSTAKITWDSRHLSRKHVRHTRNHRGKLSSVRFHGGTVEIGLNGLGKPERVIIRRENTSAGLTCPTIESGEIGPVIFDSLPT